MPLHVGSRYAALLGGLPRGIPRRGLVAHYDFVQSADSQVLSDISGNGNHGTLGSTAGVDTNDPTWGGGGLTFDGVDDRVECPATVMPSGNSSRTVMVVATCPASGATRQIVGGGTAGTHQQFCIADTGTGSGQLSVQIFGDDLSTTIVPTTTPQLVTARYEGTTRRLSLIRNTNVVDSASTTLPGDLNYQQSTPFYLGRGRQYVHDGALSYALVYNRALSDAEIRQTYRALQRILAGRGISI